MVIETTDAPSLWAPERRGLVVGLVMTITMVAFEAMAVAAIMPDVKDDLGGLALYGWVFSGFFLGSLVGIVVAGRWADARGLVAPFVVGLGLFSAGLVVGGLAPSMEVLVLGRVLQGFGAGAIPAIGYVAIGRGIPAALRPRMFAVLSTAWVLPGLVGPSAALGIEHGWSWRGVFWILVPLAVVAGWVTAPALAAIGPQEPAEEALRAEHAQAVRRVLVLVVGLAALFAAAGDLPLVARLALVAVGVPLALGALVRLLPPGTLRFRAGVPATVMLRGVLTFGFFAADAYVPLAVVDGRGGSSWLAGVALTMSALTWTAGAWTQARLIDRLGPRLLDRVGFLSLAAGVALLLGVAIGLPVPLVVLAWAGAGFGIGLAYAPQAVTVLGAAAPGEEGAASAAIQLSDAVGIALGTGVGGAIVALGDGRGWDVSTSVTATFAVALAVCVVGVVGAGRLPTVVPKHDG